MTPPACTEDTLVQQTTAEHLEKATNREKYALIRDGVQVTFRNEV